MKYNKYSFFVLALLFSGCASSVEKVNNTVKLDKFPKYQVPKEIEPPKAKAKGSLFSDQTNSLFSDRKALQMGDIVNIKIDESNDARTGGTATLEQKENVRNKESGFSATTSEDTPSLLKKIVTGIASIVSLDFIFGDSTSAFDTESESTSDDELQNDIATVVTQEFQNGNYFIEGEKNVIIKGQKITIKLSGVMNPQDLSANNEVDSKRLANLKVMLYKTGREADLDEKPWGTKIIDTISPF